MLHLAPVSAELVVEGHDDDAGAFRGRVIAVAVAVDDGPDAGERSGPSASTTWLLVADEERPAPLWVAPDAISAQRLGR